MKRYIAILIAIVVFVSLFASCKPNENEEKELKHIVIIIGNHANGTLPKINIDTLKNVLMSFSSIGDSVDVICLDGKPQIVSDYCFTISSGQPIGELDTFITKLERTAKDNTKIIAENPEVDLFAALKLTSNIFRDKTPKSHKYLFIFDGGLSTQGVLDFSKSNHWKLIENFTKLNDNKVETALFAQRAETTFPDLLKVKVIWCDVGVFSEEQNSLLKNSKFDVDIAFETFFKRLLKLCKVEEDNIKMVFSGSSQDVPNASEYPYVRLITQKSEILLEFYSERVEFEGNEDFFLKEKEESIHQALDSLVNYMKQNRSFKVLLIGTTAKDKTQNKEEHIVLSEKRANTVKRYLTGKGVYDTQIVTLGKGYDWKHVENYVNGEFNDFYAKVNRQVILLDATSKEAKKILSK